MSGASIAAEVDAALREVARDVGAGTYTVTLVEPAPQPSTPWDTPSGTATEYTVNAMVSRYPNNLIDGTLIQATDKRVLVSAVGPVPQTSWRIEIEGVSHEIVSVTPLQPSGVALMYQVQARV